MEDGEHFSRKIGSVIGSKRLSEWFIKKTNKKVIWLFAITVEGGPRK
jgi:hypothetical protein